MEALPRSFYERKTQEVAKSLLGRFLVRKIGRKLLVGRIVETEAYVGSHDQASHSRFGKTKRNLLMFGETGFSYIYLVYGIHHCLNVVTGPKEYGAAVLIRAIEPIKNISQKTNGPGLLCAALKIDLSDNGRDLTKKGSLFIASGEVVSQKNILASERIGVSYSGIWAKRKLRFLLKGNTFVSRS